MLTSEGGEIDDLVVVQPRRSATTLTLSGTNPADSAASMAARTMASSPRRRIWAKRCGWSESQLTFTRCNPAPGQSGGVSGQRRPVGGKGDVVKADRRQLAHQFDQATAHERLSTSQPQRAHAQRTRHPGHPGYLVKGQDLVSGPERYTFFGHAVDAAQVAPVRDRDPQVGVGTPVRVNAARHW